MRRVLLGLLTALCIASAAPAAAQSPEPAQPQTRTVVVGGYAQPVALVAPLVIVVVAGLLAYGLTREPFVRR